MLDYGNGRLANAIEDLIKLGEGHMETVMQNLVWFCFIFLILNMVYEIFLLAGNLDMGQVFKKILTEFIIGISIMFLIRNWMPILNSFIMPLLFQKIPAFLFNFKIGGHTLWNSSDKVLLNLDTLWATLEQVPDKIGENKGGLQVLIEWVMISNIGIYLSYLALKIIAWFTVVLMFADIMREIIMMHLTFMFSGIILPLSTFKPFRDQYSLNIVQTLLICTFQYYMLFLLVGTITGFMEFLLGNYGMFIHIMGLLLLKGMFNGILKAIHLAGESL